MFASASRTVICPPDRRQEDAGGDAVGYEGGDGMRLTVLAGLGDVARHFLTFRVSKGDACPSVILF